MLIKSHQGEHHCALLPTFTIQCHVNFQLEVSGHLDINMYFLPPSHESPDVLFIDSKIRGFELDDMLLFVNLSEMYHNNNICYRFSDIYSSSNILDFSRGLFSLFPYLTIPVIYDSKIYIFYLPVKTVRIYIVCISQVIVVI